MYLIIWVNVPNETMIFAATKYQAVVARMYSAGKEECDVYWTKKLKTKLFKNELWFVDIKIYIISIEYIMLCEFDNENSLIKK